MQDKEWTLHRELLEKALVLQWELSVKEWALQRNLEVGEGRIGVLHRLSYSILGMHGGIYCDDLKTLKGIPLCIFIHFLTYEFFG